MAPPEKPRQQTVTEDTARHHSLNESELRSGTPTGSRGPSPSLAAARQVSPRSTPGSLPTVAVSKTGGTSMVAQLTPFWHWLCVKCFSGVDVEDERVKKIQQAAEQGTLVYIVNTRSDLMYLLLNFLFLRFDLPLSRIAPGFLYVPWLTLGEQFAAIKARLLRLAGVGPSAPERFRDIVRSGNAATLFLHSPTSIWHTLRAFFMARILGPVLRLFLGPHTAIAATPAPAPAIASKSAASSSGNSDPATSPQHSNAFNYLLQLVKLQREQRRPLFLCPQTVVWVRGPVSEKPTFFNRVLDTILGDRDHPGTIRELIMILFDRHRTRLRGGPPINLQTLIAETPDLSDYDMATRIDSLLAERIESVYRAVKGPKQRAHADMKSAILRSRRVLQAIQNACAAGKSKESVIRQCSKIVDGMACTINVTVIRMFAYVLRRIFSEIYRGIDYNEDGLNKLSEASLKAPLVLIPCHKSHLDYLLLSYIFFKEGVPLPAIAAGDNLNIPLVGRLLQSSGAFFIRRSFANDEIYTAIFKEYVLFLLQQGQTIEFFYRGWSLSHRQTHAPENGVDDECGGSRRRKPDSRCVHLPHFNFVRSCHGECCLFFRASWRFKRKRVDLWAVSRTEVSGTALWSCRCQVCRPDFCAAAPRHFDQD
eukprot:TRINITY_DN2351_c0_g1_i1.p1 TRINITY_DN2351_c0_g1~~TRINITY_DN2351_c0_g1_i1.p1  ORF type:complete len:717 (-),score=147.93 TRINITY_DN2351_c0_g1_i1:1344-3290(-)